MPAEYGYSQEAMDTEERELPILGKTFSEAEEKAIVSFVLGIKKSSEEHYAQRRAKWIDYLSHYTNKKREKTRTTIPVPLAQEHVDIFISDMVRRQMGSKPFCSVRGRNEEDEMKAPMVESLLEYQYQQMLIWELYYTTVKSAGIYGSAPWRVVYDQDYIDVPIPGTTWERRVVKYSGPVIQAIDIFDYFPCPSKVKVNDAAPHVIRFYRPYEYYEERADNYPEIYKNVHEIPHKRMANMEEDDFNARQEREAIMGMQSTETGRGLITGYECDCWWPVYKKDGTKIRRPFIFTIANGKLVRANRNPYISQDGNMGLAVIDRIPGDLYGVGMVEKQHPYIHGANTALDMVLTNLEQSINRRKIVNTEMVKREEELNGPLGGVIHSRGDARMAVAWEDPLQVSADAYNILALFRASGESATGGKPIKQGVVSGETATATMQAASEANSRFHLYMMMLENTFVKPSCSMMHKINQQFLDLPMLIPILGQDAAKWEAVDEQTIAIDPDFIPEGSMREMNKEMNIAQIEKAMMIIGNIPAMLGLVPVLVGKLWREFRWQDADKVQEIANGMVAMFQQAEQQAQQQEGGGPMAQIGGPSQVGGMEATNSSDLNQSVGSEFGPSAFS